MSQSNRPETVTIPSKAIASCEGEQYAFEDWAGKNHYDMAEHPLHYLFLDSRTDAARQGWRAALEYVRNSSTDVIPTRVAPPSLEV